MNTAWALSALHITSLLACSSFSDSVNPTGFSKHCQNTTKTMKLFPGIAGLLNVSQLHAYEGPFEVEPSNKSFAVQYNYQSYPYISLQGQEGSSSLFCLKTKPRSEKAYYISLNIILYYCPPGFIHTPQGTCVCPIKVTNPDVACNQAALMSGVIIGFCTSRDNGTSPLLIARCVFANRVIKPLLPIGQINETGKVTFCGHLKRKGRLCSECLPNHTLSVFSDTFDCIPCSSFKVSSFILYLTIEILPTTVFVLFILFFHIGITSSAANGFLFFAQMISAPLEVLFLTYGLQLYVRDNEKFATALAHFIVTPYCIWNLDFFRIFNQNICLHPDLKVVHVLALWYILAFYPLILLIVAYIAIELKARNIRIVTRLWWLVCFSCVRWRRTWKAKSSVIDAFASCILLSYTRFMLASLAYLSSSVVYDNYRNRVDKVLAFDTSVHFMGRKHMPYVIVAISILLTFGAFPPLILTFYQFQPFQYCLQHIRMNTLSLKRFVEAFQGCYKDGTDGKTDCRFFAGLYFVFRCVILAIMGMTHSFPTGFTSIIIVSAIFLLLLAIFQPYKERVYNIVDSIMVFLFGVVTSLQMYIYNHLQFTLEVSPIFLLYYLLLYLPLIYMTAYVCKWLYCQWKQRNNRACTPVPRDTDFFRDSILDERVERKSTSDPGRGKTLTRKTPSHSEVSITREGSDSEEETLERPGSCSGAQCEGDNWELGGGGGTRFKEVVEESESIRQNPTEGERLLQRRELIQYGSIQ